MKKGFCAIAVCLVVLAVTQWPALAHDTPGSAVPKGAQPPKDVSQVLERYKSAMEALSLEQMDPMMDPDLLVLEHGGKDVGWRAYRDGHLGGHMKEWKSFQVSDVKVLESSNSGDWVYVAQESLNTIVMKKDDKTFVMAVTETFVLKRRPDGWKIKHLHISLKKKSSS